MKYSGLTKEEKETKAEKYANEMANELRGVYGIDSNVDIVIHFTDDPKGDEIGAFVREDKKIEIYLNPKEIDLSDMNQVYSGLGFEMNHYNPSNPYVYNKTEEQAGKGNKLEELFTGIGRKTIDGHENNFYNDVLKGGSVLETGNSLYGEIDESKLDFCGNPIQCPYWKFDYKENKTVPRVPEPSRTPIGAGLTLEEIKVTTQTGIDSRKKDKAEKEKNPPCDSKCKAKEAERVGKTPKMNSNGEYIVLEELENSEFEKLFRYKRRIKLKLYECCNNKKFWRR